MIVRVSIFQLQQNAPIKRFSYFFSSIYTAQHTDAPLLVILILICILFMKTKTLWNIKAEPKFQLNDSLALILLVYIFFLLVTLYKHVHHHDHLSTSSFLCNVLSHVFMYIYMYVHICQCMIFLLFDCKHRRKNNKLFFSFPRSCFICSFRCFLNLFLYDFPMKFYFHLYVHPVPSCCMLFSSFPFHLSMRLWFSACFFSLPVCLLFI